MKRILLIINILCLCMVVSAQRKVETFDDNKWNWMEGNNKYQSVSIENGFLHIQAIKANKKASDYQNMAKSYAKLPIRAKDDFKLNVVVNSNSKKGMIWQLWFNTEKTCLEDEDESGQFNTSYLMMIENCYYLVIGDGQVYKDKLPVKLKKENTWNITITKKKSKAIIEINGIEIFNDKCDISNPCMGFAVPVGYEIHVDEVSVEQAQEDD